MSGIPYGYITILFSDTNRNKPVLFYIGDSDFMASTYQKKDTGKNFSLGLPK